jgi:hypothetical protein
MYRRFVAVGVAVVLTLSASTVLAQCGCGPVVTTYAPSYTAYYAPTPYVAYYASPTPYVTYYRPVTPYVTYYAPVVRPYVTYYRMPRWSFYWGW